VESDTIRSSNPPIPVTEQLVRYVSLAVTLVPVTKLVILGDIVVVVTSVIVVLAVLVIVVVIVVFVGNEMEPIPIPSTRTAMTTAAHATLFMNAHQGL
jgi:hypothetical protein